MLAIPYWDSVMDNYLPDPRDSVVFLPEFLGEVDPNGFLVNGPYAFWRTIEGRNTIMRILGTEGQLFREDQLITILDQSNIEFVS